MRRFLFWAVLLFAGATEVDAQSFLERLGQRAARAAEDALTRKAEQAVEQAIDKVSDPETYKKEGQSQDPVGSTIAGQAVVVQSGDGVNFYFELVPPPALDPAWDVIELQNGYYLSETGALDRTPVDVDAVRLGESVLRARPGDQWSGGAPVYLLELPRMDYRAEVGVDRDFNGRQCREVLVRIPITHSSNEQLQAHILCPRPPQGSGDNQSTTAHRYIAPASTEYELVAVRIYRKPGAPPVNNPPTDEPEEETPLTEAAPSDETSTNEEADNSTETEIEAGANDETDKSTEVTNDNETTKQKDNDYIANYYDRYYQLRSEFRSLVYIRSVPERDAKLKEIAARLENFEDGDLKEELEAELEEAKDEETKYEIGEDVWVEIVPPAPLLSTDSIQIDISYQLSTITNVRLEKADRQMGYVTLDLDRHKTRPGNARSGGQPVIMLDLQPHNYDKLYFRENEWEGKPCHELVIEIPFVNPVSNKRIPAHIICPRPGYKGDESIQDLAPIPPGKNDRVFIAMRIFEKTDWAKEAREVFDGTTTLIQRYLMRRSLEEELTAKVCDVLEVFGLITITPTGKFATWGSEGSTEGYEEYEYSRIEVTGLGQKYLFHDKWTDEVEKRVQPPWISGERPDYGSEQYKREMNRIADIRERLGRYYEDGELWYAGHFDDQAILRDIAAGTLKVPDTLKTNK